MNLRALDQILYVSAQQIGPVLFFQLLHNVNERIGQWNFCAAWITSTTTWDLMFCSWILFHPYPRFSHIAK